MNRIFLRHFFKTNSAKDLTKSKNAAAYATNEQSKTN
jgi:hypothetical protein